MGVNYDRQLEVFEVPIRIRLYLSERSNMPESIKHRQTSEEQILHVLEDALALHIQSFRRTISLFCNCMSIDCADS